MEEKDLIEKFKNGEKEVKGVKVEVMWFVVIEIVEKYIMVRKRLGKWIFEEGGDEIEERN